MWAWQAYADDNDSLCDHYTKVAEGMPDSLRKSTYGLDTQYAHDMMSLALEWRRDACA